MGVDVVLMKVSQSGTSPRRRRVVPVGSSVLDHREIFANLVQRLSGLGRLPMLERIDPYGDLILTSADMPQLLEELARARSLACSAAENETLTGVERLAVTCRDDSMLELHLLGD